MDEVLNELYTGAKLESTHHLHDGTQLKPYFPEPKLKEAVNLAIALGKPLLVMGEPGCGKTKLASSVAFEIFQKELTRKRKPIKFKDIFFEWSVKSTSKASDGLYQYNYIKKLQDTQLKQIYSQHKEDEKTKEEKEDPYVNLGPLGTVFQKSSQFNKPLVLLIDEIDKAPFDFPNDLLRELDEMKFEVTETKDIIKADKENKPLIVITSNDEKDLPVPFLRRCLFYHINFPGEDRLREIVAAHFSERGHTSELIEKVVNTFWEVRTAMDNTKEEWDKKVSTSELIDWCEILLRHSEKDILKLLKGELPYSTLLFKRREDLDFANSHL